MHKRRRDGRDDEDGLRVVSRELDLSFGPAVMIFDKEEDDSHVIIDREHAVSLTEMG